MKNINLDDITFSHKNELRTLLTAISDAEDKYVKTKKTSEDEVAKLNTEIDKKKNNIDKLNETGENLSKKEEELEELKSSAKSTIKDLETRKKEVSFSDSEVQKMELEDIETLITLKKNNVTNIDTKINDTKEKARVNNESLKGLKVELDGLEANLKDADEDLSKTNAIIDILTETSEKLVSKIDDILHSELSKNTISEPKVTKKEEPKEEIKIEPPKPIESEPKKTKPKKEKEDDDLELEPIELDLNFDEDDDDDVLDDDDDDDLDLEEPAVKPEVDIPKEEVKPVEIVDDIKPEVETPKETIEIKNDVVEDSKKEEKKNDSVLNAVFSKETISFDDFSKEDQDKMEAMSDRVIKNIDILKKHNIPLEYTTNQASIYYDIDSQDLEDLLNIITSDEDGNGMGFSVDFTYHILKELSHTNVDKLIDVYNSEFMNIDSKSGLIELIKKATNGSEDFEENRKANEKMLEEFGIKDVDKISSNYPEFINIDNPLFSEILNMFDKDDLVDKLNSDMTIIPQIIEYWKNN